MTLIGIGGRSLTYADETRVVGIAREMAIESEYALPRLNGAPYLEYPSLGYLPLVALFRLGAAPNDFLALLPSALAALATLFLTYRMGCMIGGELAGLASALALQCTFGFLVLHTRALVDPLLVAWITASLTGFLAAAAAPRLRAGGMALFHVGLAGGFLTKGLLGIAIPVAVAGCFLIAARRAREIPRLALHPTLALLLLPIAIWQVGVWAAGGSELAAEVWRQSARRFASSGADHAAPFTFYFDRLLYLLIPGVVLLPWLLWDALAPRRRQLVRERSALDRFPAVWFGVVLAGLSLASAKRNLYLGPIYPGFALMLGTWWARAQVEPPRARAWHRLVAAVPRRAPLALALYGLGYLGYSAAFEYPDSAAHDPAPLFADVALQRRDAGGRIVLVNPRESMLGAAVYYLGETFPVAWDEHWLDTADASPGAYLLVGHAQFLDPLVARVDAAQAEILATHDLAGEPYRIARVRLGGAGEHRVRKP